MLFRSVATIFLVLFLFCLRISRRASDQFGRYFAFGAGVSLALCAFMNMGVSLKLFPPKGMVLPFLSLYLTQVRGTSVTTAGAVIQLDTIAIGDEQWLTNLLDPPPGKQPPALSKSFATFARKVRDRRPSEMKSDSCGVACIEVTQLLERAQKELWSQ